MLLLFYTLIFFIYGRKHQLKKNKLKCKLCGNYFDDNEMSEEHYPARSVGNDDIVAVDLAKTIDMLLSNEIKNKIINRVENGENLKQVSDDLLIMN